MKGHSAVDEKTLKIFLILGLFMVVWTMNVVFFRNSYLNLTIIGYSLINFFVVFVNLLCLTKILLSKIGQIKWVMLIITLILLYVFSLYALTVPLKFMIWVYPDNFYINYHYENNYIHSYEDIFLFSRFLWLLSQLYFHLILFFAAYMLFKYTQSLKKISELRVINAHQELNLLKSQIHPHFLFNTLNNLYRLVMNNEQAGEVVLKLSETLRFTLYESNVDELPLKMETKFLQNYIELQKINQGSNVDIRYDFKEIENDEILIAPMLFFDFIEIVLKQGYNKTIDKFWVEIKLKQSKEILNFEIRNNIIIKTNAPFLQEQGFSNIKKRIDKIYPDKYTLETHEDKKGYMVNLILKLK